MTASGLTRIPLTIVSTANGARTEGVLVGVMADQLDALEARANAEFVYEGSDNQRWREAEASRVMLRDALREFHAFVVDEIDPGGGSVADYLAGWDEDRLTELEKELGDD